VLDVEVLGSESHPTLRITLDREAGVSLENCVEMSRRVSPLLDVEEVIGGSYQLEVSSPGLNRPLKRLDDFERYRDKRAKIETRRPPFADRKQKRFTGVLRGTREQQVELEEDGGTLVSIPFAVIERANLIYEFGEHDFGNRGDSKGSRAPTRRRQERRGPRPSGTSEE
jgi:ribosome maturation factor RimP